MSVFDDTNAAAERARRESRRAAKPKGPVRQQTEISLHAVLKGSSDYPRLVCGRHDDGCEGEFGHLVVTSGHLFMSAGWREHEDGVWRLRDRLRRDHHRSTARSRRDPEAPHQRTPTRMRQAQHVVLCECCGQLNRVDLTRLGAKTDADDGAAYAAMYGPTGAIRALGLPNTIPARDWSWRQPGQRPPTPATEPRPGP